MSRKSIFIVWWSHSRRAATLATELGLDGPVSFQYESKLAGCWLTPLRYLVQGWKTWRLLERAQPEVVIVQVPPIFAALLAAVWCTLHGNTRPVRDRACFAMDCHTGTFDSRRWRWTLPLLRLLSRRAALTVVASEAALRMLQRWRARAIFLVDGLPTLAPPTGTAGSEGEARVAVIGSFHADEPVAEVFGAARLLPHVSFYISGDSRRLPRHLLTQMPENVILTGFLPDSDFTGLLTNVHGVVVLTTRPNVLNCGAYEALAAGRPAVLSDWPQMRRYFTQGFIYVNNTPEAIAAGVQQMLDGRATLTTDIIAMRSELEARRRPRFDELAALLSAPWQRGR